MIVGVVADLDPGPEDAHASMEAAELLRKPARQEFVLEAPRRRDSRQPRDPGHAGQTPRKFLRVHQGLAGRVVHGNQDDRRLALRLEHILDERGYVALAEHERPGAAQHQRAHVRQLDERPRRLGRVGRGFGALAFVDHHVLDEHTLTDGRQPDGARARPFFGRQREAEQPAVAVLAEKVGRLRVRWYTCCQTRVAERGKTVEPECPLAMEQGEVVEVGPGDEQLRSMGRAHGLRSWPRYVGSRYFPGCGAGSRALDFAFAPRDSKQMPLRLFLVHEDSSIDRIALSRFERLVTRNDPNERWPEYAGKRLRYALLSVEQDADSNEYMRVIHASYGFITLDAEGRRCKASAKKGMRDAMELMGGMMSSNTEQSNVIGERAFRQRRYKVEHTWEPSEEVVDRICDALAADTRPVRRTNAHRPEV